jgi:hypothetical protein
MIAIDAIEKLAGEFREELRDLAGRSGDIVFFIFTGLWSDCRSVTRDGLGHVKIVFIAHDMKRICKGKTADGCGSAGPWWSHVSRKYFGCRRQCCFGRCCGVGGSHVRGSLVGVLVHVAALQ